VIRRRVLLRRLYGRDEVVILLGTYAVFLILEDVLLLVWGAEGRSAYQPYIAAGNITSRTFEEAEKAIVGEVLLAWTSSEHSSGEIGFIFHPGYHRRGYGTRAARHMLAMGFEELRLHRIIGRCEARNIASAALMDKLGMRREAHFRENEWVKGEWNDELVYAMLASEWEVRSAGRA
jgi:RimJ/RimL family protein N-acetyltransferase